MDPVIKQILNSSLTIDLPIVFVTASTNPTQKKRKRCHPSRSAVRSRKEGEEAQRQRGQRCSTQAYQKQSQRIQDERR
jgi:hypothetical protein